LNYSKSLKVSTWIFCWR